MSQALFASYPPFPDDLTEANISVISLAKLKQKDEYEAWRLLQTCTGTGFFLIDLNGDSLGDEMIKEIDGVFDAVHDAMLVDGQEKEQFLVNPSKSIMLGYKLPNTAYTGTSQRDSSTFFHLSQDTLFGNGTPQRLPKAVESHYPLLKSFVEHGQAVLALVFAALEAQLQLPTGTFRERQRTDRTSGTIIRMIRCEGSPAGEDRKMGLIPHTDLGTMTLLTNILGGLQVLEADQEPADETAWRWVRPRPGCLVVNVGDTMVEWTGGLLRSNMHRVNCAPGEQRYADRMSFALLVRAADDAPMGRIEGGRIPGIEDDEARGFVYAGTGAATLTASEWERRKVTMILQGKDIAQSRGRRASGTPMA